MKNSPWIEAEWRAMRRRMVDCIARQCSELAPASLTVDTSIYTDAQRHAAEREELFMCTPLLAGLSRDLPEPGSMLLFDGFGPPVVIIRRDDGSLAAFQNVCPHRGARLVDCERRRDSFVCPFHGWRFDLQGRLLHRALPDAFADAASPSLTPVAVAEHCGLVFIQHRSPSGDLDLEDFLAPIAALLRSFRLDEAEPIHVDELVVAANWKLVVDISCEGYHVPATHPRSLSPQLVPFLTIHDSFGRHHRFASPGREVVALVEQPEAAWPPAPYSAVHYLFPNTILTVSAAIDGKLPVIAINRSFPGREIGETRVLYSSYRPGTASEALAEEYRAVHDAVVEINRTEDLPMVSGAWRNYASLPTPAPLVFGRNEALLQRYHRDVAEACNMPLPVR